MPPLLSIITVCRNEFSRIHGTLDSVINQSDTAFEWIVVDGASTDGTLNLLQSHQQHISRLISEPDEGLYEAMNKGIQAASGQYVIFLNAGDRLENRDVVTKFRKEAFTADLVIGNLRVQYSDGQEQYRKSIDCPLNADRLYWRSYPHPATFIRRDLFARFGLYDLTMPIAADWEFFVRVVVRHGVTCVAWDHGLAIFPNDGISASSANKEKILQQRQRIRQMYYPTLYRWRRGINEAWGRLLNHTRQNLNRYRSYE